MFLRQKVPWTTQPPSGAVVDPKWGAAFVVSPLASGMLHDHAQNNPGTIASAANLSGTKAGRSVLFPSGSCYATLPSRDAYNLLGPITLVWVGVIDTLAQYQFLITRAAGNGATNNPFEFRVNSGGGIQLHRANASAYATWATTTSPPVGTPCVMVATHGGDLADSVGASLWINGVSCAVTRPYTASGVATGNTEPMYLGTRGDTYSYMRGSCALAMGFPRVLMGQEIVSLSANPWQVFVP